MEDQGFVLQKLASTLALLYQKLGSEWQQPVRHLLASVINGGYLAPSELPSMGSLLAVINQCPQKQIAGVYILVITIPEDVSSRAPGSTVQQQLALNSSDALELICHALVGHCRRYVNPAMATEVPPTSLPQMQSSNLSLLALEALPHWTSLLKLQESVASNTETTGANNSAILCLKACIEMLNRDAMAHYPLQALVTIEALSPRLLSRADPNFIPGLAAMPFVQKWATGLVQGDFSAELMLFAELVEAILMHVDTTSSDYILSGKYTGVLELLLMLLRCEGAAGVEDQVCRMMLESANNIIEGFNDWDPEPTADQTLRTFAQRVCEACLHKVQYPSEELDSTTRSWDKDDLAAFREFRLDVEDFLQSAFSLLGKGLIDAVAASVRKGPATADWAQFEAGLYCLQAFVDTINSDETLYHDLVGSVLESHYFQQVVQSQPTPDAAKKTCILFLSSMTSYLKGHPSLMQSLNFLFSSLQQPSSSSVASRAIYSLCDSQRKSLIGALAGFMASLSTIDHLRGMVRHRIYGAVSAVIQALPDEAAKIAPLHEILTFLKRDIESPSKPKPGEEHFLQHSTDLLQTLAAIGRGLREPDTGTDKSENTQRDQNFWFAMPGAKIQQQVLDVYRSIVQRVGSHSSYDLVEASCDFVKSGFTESNPSPFKFQTSVSAELVVQYISVDTPNIDAAMSMASGLLAAVSTDDFQPHFQALIHPVIAGMQQLLSSQQDHITQIRDSLYPAAVLDFMSRLLPTTHARVLLDLAEAQQILDICVELALVVLSQPDTLPRRSAAQFLGTFNSLSKADRFTEASATQNVAVMTSKWNPRIMASLLRLIGGECARSEIEIMADQIRRFVITQPMVFKSISKEAMQEGSGVLTQKALLATTLDQRLRFVAQVDGLRGGRKTTEVVKNFWVSCKGSEYSYIA